MDVCKDVGIDEGMYGWIDVGMDGCRDGCRKRLMDVCGSALMEACMNGGRKVGCLDGRQKEGKSRSKGWRGRRLNGWSDCWS